MIHAVSHPVCRLAAASLLVLVGLCVAARPAAGQVRGSQKISDVEGGFTGGLESGDRFGKAVTTVGDVDGNGVPDLAVGAERDDDGGSVQYGSDRGGVWILYLRDDGTVLDQGVISATQGGLNLSFKKDDRFGSGLASIGDLDGDGIDDLAVGARLDDGAGGDFADRGAVYVLFLNADETVRDATKISDTGGEFVGTLPDDARFGTSVASLGDVNDDGIPDVAVGTDATVGASVPQGRLWVLLLNRDGTVQSQQEVAAGTGGFGGPLGDDDNFGFSVAGIGDRDDDGVPDLIAGAPGGGAAWILYLKSDGSVTREQKISNTEGGFDGTLRAGERFGSAVASAGDLDADGTDDLAVGAAKDMDGAGSLPDGAGAVWMLFGEAPQTPLTLTVTETVTVSDAPQVTPPASISVTETISVTDAPAVRPPLQISVTETIAVSDAPQVTPPLRLSVTETITVSDGPTATPSKTLTLALGDRWNLLSVPVQAKPETFAAVLPNCTSGFFFDPETGYTSVAPDTPLPAGRGGFFKCRAGQRQITGLPVAPEVPVETGWNLVGTFDEAAGVQSVTSTPAGIVASPFFRLDPTRGYRVASTLKPTEAYWVRANQAGTLALDDGSKAAALAATTEAEGKSLSTPTGPDPADAVQLVVTDDKGHRATLHLAAELSDEQRARSALPPVPPTDVFDVRYGNDRQAAALPAREEETADDTSPTRTVTWQGTSGPVQLRATDLPDDQTLHLQDAATGGTLVDAQLTASSPSAEIPPRVHRLTVAAQQAPGAFALQKSRPNPASQRATVEYALPTTAEVSIELYDVLGRRVTQLVHGPKEPGVHRTQLDVSALPSGVYVVRMRADGFAASRRLTVVR